MIRKTLLVTLIALALPSAASAQDPRDLSIRTFRLKNMKAENLTSKSILTGPPQKIIEDLKAVERSGISEVILYFNYGLKPYGMVIEQMDRFAAEIAPAFADAAKAAE